MKIVIYKIALKIIGNRLENGTLLTPSYLHDKGWELVRDKSTDKLVWREKEIKDRDMISIQFEAHYYRVWHSEKMTFIACETKQEWFDLYYKLLSK